MGTLKLNYKRGTVKEKDGKSYGHNTLLPGEFAQFNVGLLDLGSLGKDSTVTNTLAAVFDLDGFTDFCSQIDPHLVIPEFLTHFLDWLFESIRKHFTKEETKDMVQLWGSLPFFGKFTGDGVLFLWNTDLSGGATGIGNIVLQLRIICSDYLTELYPILSKNLSKVPKRLRVGIARGQVMSVGENKDFVGPCINMAARLQKLGSLSFAVSRKGFDPDECFPSWKNAFVIKKIHIRGIGEEEPVILLAQEYNALNKKEKALFF